MNLYNYNNQLISVFNQAKHILLSGKEKVIIIKPEEDYSDRDDVFLPIPKFNEQQNFYITTTSLFKYVGGDYIHLSGVNVLFYIVCLYIRANTGNYGTYYHFKNPLKKGNEKFRILKDSVFIFEENDDGFWYYPISSLTSNSNFKFDLPDICQSD